MSAIVEAAYTVPLECPDCGCPALDEAVPLGRVYRVDLDSIEPNVVLRCGCGRSYARGAIRAEEPRNPDGWGWLPTGIFESEALKP